MIDTKNKSCWDTFFTSIVLFTVFRCLLMKPSWIFYYDYVNDIYWYLLAFIIPAILAVSIALFLKSKILNNLSVIFFHFLLS